MSPHTQSATALPFRRGALVLLLAAAPLLRAQDKPAQASPEEEKKEDVITLQAFEVNTVRSNDYVASESVTGTRVASKLRDLPFQVNVITSEFMADFSAFEMPEQLGFISNVSPSDSQGTLSLRGFTTTPFVNGFRRLGDIAISNIDRVEVIKGPSASIYGQVLPGGVVNYLTKRPKAATEKTIDVSYGTNGFFRVAASSTGKATPSGKILYRFDFSDQSRNYDQMFADRRTTYVAGTLLFKWDPVTNIMVKFDYTRSFNHDPQSIPWVKSSTKGYVTKADGTALTYSYLTSTGAVKTINAPYGQVVDRYTNNPTDVANYLAYLADPAKYNYTFTTQYGALNTTNSWDHLDMSLVNVRSDGPLGYTETTTSSGTLTADRKISEHYNVRYTFDSYVRPYAKQSSSGNQVYYTDPNYPGGELGLLTPTYRLNPRTGYTTQLDNLFSFDTGPVAHKLLGTIDYAYQSQRDFSRATLTSGSYWKDASGNVYRNADGQIYTGTTSPGTGYTKYSVITDSYYTVVDPMSGVSYAYGLPLGAASNKGAMTYPWTDSNWFYPTFKDYPNSYTQLKTNNVTNNNDLGLFASERATFFRGRLIALIGGRFDMMRNNAINYLNAVGSQNISWTNHAFTHQMGLTGYVTKNIVLFANQSTTYNPNPQYKTYSDGSFDVFPNEKGQGYEFGSRFVAFNQRLNIGLSRFVIDRSNKLDSWTDEFGTTQYIASGKQRSSGYEVDFNWQVTDGFQILGGYGYNDAKYTASTLAYLIGTTTPQSAKDNVGIAARYRFQQGRLKGLSLVADAKYLSRSLVSVGSGGVITTNPFAKSGFKPVIYNVPLYSGTLPFPTLPQGLAILSRNATVATDSSSGLSNNNSGKGYTAAPSNWALWTPGATMTSGTQYYVWDGDGSSSASYTRTTSIDDGRMNVYNQPYTIYGFGINYTFKTRKSVLRHTVRLALKNAFDKVYTYGGGVIGDGRQWIGTYSISF